MLHPRQNSPVPAWLWLLLPLALYFGHYVLRLLLPDSAWQLIMLGEFGFTEQATVLLLGIAMVAGVIAALRMWRLGQPLLAAFFLLFALGCLYFLGEEISWGQHWMGWAAPEDWGAVNLQDETNVHNMPGTLGWLTNTLPRNLLSAGMLIGGALIPLWQRWRGHHYSAGSLADWIMPGAVCIPIGLIAPLAGLPQKLAADPMPWWLDITVGEVKELMMAAFLMIYILAVCWRLPLVSRS